MGINRSERQRGLRGADKDASSRAAHVHGPLQMRVRLGEELLTGCICAGGRGWGSEVYGLGRFYGVFLSNSNRVEYFLMCNTFH